jgi:hypothetical protein
MSNELCFSGFGGNIDGQYYLMYCDHWSNGTYWLYKDSFNWIISSSEFLYGEGYIIARKEYVAGSWANGNYVGVNGNPSGTVALAFC